MPSALAAVGPAEAADTSVKAPNYEALGKTPSVKKAKALVDCHAPDAPYKRYACLDAYLGDGFFERLSIITARMGA